MKRLTLAKCYSCKCIKLYLPLPLAMGHNSPRDCTQWTTSKIDNNNTNDSK